MPPIIPYGNRPKVRRVRQPPAPKPKPYKPTPTQIRSSRAQAQGYASQGKAVQKVARRQRVVARAKATENAYRSQGQQVQRQANAERDAQRASAWGGNQKLPPRRVAALIRQGYLERHTTGLFAHELRLGPAHPGYAAEQRKIANLSRFAEEGSRGNPLADTTAPALRIMSEEARTLHGSAATANALVKGENVGKALKAGGEAFLHNTPITYSDVLRSAGVKSKLARAAGGFALDIALDPLSGAKLSRLAPKEELERRAAAAEARGATKTAAKLRRQASTASDSRGIQAGYSAKIPFGPRVEAMTKGKVTAKIGKKLSPTAEKVREAKPVQAAGRALSPTFRPKGVTHAEHEADLASRRRAEQRRRAADRYAERRGTAHARAATGVDREQMIAAVEEAPKKPLTRTKVVVRKSEVAKRLTRAERGVRVAERAEAREIGRMHVLAAQGEPKALKAGQRRLTAARANLRAARQEVTAAREAMKGAPKKIRIRVDAETGKPYQEAMAGAERHTIEELPPQARQVAEATRRELDQAARQELAASVLKSTRERYYPHKLAERTSSEKLTEAAKRLILRHPSRKGRDAKLAAAIARKDERAIAEIEAERTARGREPLFSTDHGTVMAQRIQESGRAVADSQRLQDLKTKIGKPLTPSTWAKRRSTDGVYEITPTSIKPVEKRSGETDEEAVRQALKTGDTHDLVVLPRAIGNREVQRVGAERSDLRQVLRPFEKAQGAWKTVVTVLNLGFYQARNVYDDAFRAWAGDATARDFATAAIAIPKLALRERREMRELDPEAASGFVKIGQRKIPMEELLHEAEEDGALRTGFYGGELRDLEHPKVGPLSKVRPVEKIREYGQNLEDYTRLASYIGARRRGLTRDQAGKHVRLYHFDYSELTETERALRMAIPFLTYTKRNTALHARLLVSRPGKQAAVEKAREEAIKAAGLQPGFEGQLSDTDQRALPFPVLIKGNVFLAYSPLGITDLNRIPFVTTWEQVKALPRQQYDLVMQLVSPLVKTPVELLNNYSFFFRDAIYRDANHPTAKRWQPAPAEVAALPASVRADLNIRKVGGQWMWPTKLDYLVRSAGPQIGLLTTLGTPAKNSRGQTAKTRLLTQATGIRWVDYETQRLKGVLDELYQQRGNIDAKLADLEDTGRKTSQQYKRLTAQRDVVSATLDSLNAKLGGNPQLAKVYSQLATVKAKLAKTRKTTDGFYYTAAYQRLHDEQVRLEKQSQRLQGVKPKKVTRISSRPLTPEQQMQQKFEEYRNRTPEQQMQALQKRFDRWRAQQQIAVGGG